MECLLEIYLDGTGVEELPSSIGNLRSLVLLNLKGCSNLVSLPSGIGRWQSLKTLNLSGCYKVENLLEHLQHAEFLEELDLSETAIKKPPSFFFEFKNLKVLFFDGRKRPSSRLQQNLPSLFQVFQRRRIESMPLMLHSFSGLSSLARLNLRNCNLCEGDIPGDISCLSSLKLLDLSGNNFISIPSSLSRFSKLYRLVLRNCRELKSLPELLSSIDGVNLACRASLEVVANPLKVHNSTDCDFLTGVQCYRLAENMNALTMLKKHLKVFANSRKSFDIIIPGSEIPEGFSQQRADSSIKIPLTVNIQNDSQWMEVAFCCIFVNDDASRDEYILWEAVIHSRDSGLAAYDESVILNGNRRNVNGRGFILGKEYSKPIIKDHLVLCYWSRDILYPHSLEDKRGEREIENCSNQQCDELEFSLVYSTKYAKVKKCGIRLVYEKDLEDVQPFKEQYNNQSCAGIEDMNEYYIADG